MKDIGLGVIDRHTLIIVSLSMVLAQIFFNFQIPIDTTDANRLFADIVLFTGYLYLSRSIYRLPVALIFSLTTEVFMLSALIKDIDEEIQWRLGLEKFGRWIVLSIAVLIVVPLVAVLSLALLILNFGQLIEEKKPLLRFSIFGRPLQFFFGILDRIGLVLIAVLATVPSLRPDVKKIGIIGTTLMVIIFVIRGDFTALVRDIIEKEKREKEKRS